MKKSRDLTGQSFGSLTAIRPTDQTRNGYTIWECRCDCGRPNCLHIVYRPSRLLKTNKYNDCDCEKRRHPLFNDLTGRRFGMLTVLSEAPLTKEGHTVWNCLCDCGNVVQVEGRQLLSGNRISCGCQRRKYEEKDWVGKRFGKLTVLSHERYEKGQHFWRCLCDCGKETVVRQQHLSSGKARSCGCLAEMNLIDPDNQFKGTSIRHIKGQAGERRPTVKSHSGIRGVYPSKGKKWIAQIQFQGRTYHLGTFDNLEDARAAREKAEAEMYDATLLEWKQKLAEKKKE